MNLFIPELGTRLKLTQRWGFKLYHEDRNINFGVLVGVTSAEIKKNHWLGASHPWHWTHRNREDALQFTEVILPKSTVLIVDRIYIRQNNSNYSSVSFKVKADGKTYRFWAKLSDVNNIRCKLDA
jgi:hypothetical protein